MSVTEPDTTEPDTTEPDMGAGPLSNLRVLEIGDEQGQFCAKLLADLGADVIKIEPPGGNASRAIGPFLDDVEDPNASLSFWYYNTSKRAITLDVTAAPGRDVFVTLAANADLIVESLPPGFLPGLGLGYETLCEANPGLVMCSITPFGQTGPWRDYLSADLLHMAAGGQMASCGYDEEDAPGSMPIAPGGGNAWHMGGHYAYMGIMAALVARTMNGCGQYIDVSIHQACALTTEAAVPAYVYRGEVLRRQTGRHHGANKSPRTQFLAEDGRYLTALIANQLSPRLVERLADMMEPYGMAADLRDPRYQDAATVKAASEHIIEEVVGAFIASRPAEESYHLAQSHGFTWGAVRPAEALLDDPHMTDRGFWKTVHHPEHDRSIVYPGEAAIYSATPWRISRRAPLVGEHNDAILGQELGLSDEDIARLIASD